jgi:streptogramin lyase
MPIPDQAVIERLREALDGSEIPHRPWVDHRAALLRRSATRRRKQVGAVVAVCVVAVVAVVAAIGQTGADPSPRKDQTLKIVQPAPIRYTVAAHIAVDQQGSAPQITLGNGAVFVADWTHGRILRLNSASLKVTGQLPVGSPQSSVLSIAYGGGSLWALDFSTGSLLRIDPTSMRVLDTTPIAGQPSDVAYGDGSVWMTAVGRSTHTRTRQLLERVNPATGAVTGRTVIPGDGESEQIAVGSGVVAVSGETGPIQIVDPSTMKIVRTMADPGSHPDDMASLNGQIYVLGFNGILALSPTDGREPVVFDEQGTPAENVSLDGGLSSAAGLLWVVTARQILGVDPALGRIVSVASDRGVGEVESSDTGTPSDGSLFVDVPNGVDRLKP